MNFYYEILYLIFICNGVKLLSFTNSFWISFKDSFGSVPSLNSFCQALFLSSKKFPYYKIYSIIHDPKERKEIREEVVTPTLLPWREEVIEMSEFLPS